MRKKYWFYLNNAVNVHSGTIITNKSIYSIFTYVNIVGTFLAIGSCDMSNKININTFVRLGVGATPTEKLKPIQLEPALLALG